VHTKSEKFEFRLLNLVLTKMTDKY